MAKTAAGKSDASPSSRATARITAAPPKAAVMMKQTKKDKGNGKGKKGSAAGGLEAVAVLLQGYGVEANTLASVMGSLSSMQSSNEINGDLSVLLGATPLHSG